jgi:type IV pilus assembly protein PilM
MGRRCIGLDIGSRAVSLAEVTTPGGTPVVTRFGRALLPAGAVEHGEIQDPPAVASTITTLWKKLGLTGRSVHLGISNRRVVVRVIELPAMSKDDLESAIRFQAQDHIPIPLDEAVLDFEVLDEVQRPEGNVQHVLVVAAERGTIEPLLAAMEAARLEASTLELSAYPLVRVFGDKDSDSSRAIIDIGAGVTNIVVEQGGKIRFTRILPVFGGDEFTRAVSEALGISCDEAESLKRRASALLRTRDVTHAHARSRSHAGVRPSRAVPNEELVTSESGDVTGDPALHTNGSTPAAQIEAAADAIEPALDRFVTEVRGSLDFYTSQPDAAELKKVILVGGGSLMGGIAERLGASLGIPVEAGNPFDRAPVGKIKVTPEEMAVAEPFVGLAVGLALAGVRS